MDLNLTADQRLFRSTTQNFLAKTASIPQVRELADGPEGFARDWWQQGAELGWTAMLVPEHLGGGTISGSGLADLSIVAEELGRTCAPGPLATTSAVLTGLVASDSTEQLEGILAGDVVAVWAVYEPQQGWDPTTPGTRADRTATGFRLTGTKQRVESGDQADLFLVTASTDDGPTQLLVPADHPGVTVTPTRGLDLIRRFAEVRFDEVEVSADAVVGAVGGAAAVIERQLEVAATLHTAEMVGATDKTFEFTLQWAFDRYTFGRPLASYQALKHRFADSRTWLEACHATATAAAKAVDAGDRRAAELVSVAKSYVGSKAPVIIQDCVQLHGGIGVTWEHDLHLYLRRVAVDRALYGTPEEHRRRITGLLERNAA
jgi:alkylation response protein AidB-like acyl-CoA dehydrogenase